MFDLTFLKRPIDKKKSVIFLRNSSLTVSHWHTSLLCIQVSVYCSSSPLNYSRQIHISNQNNTSVVYNNPLRLRWNQNKTLTNFWWNILLRNKISTVAVYAITKGIESNTCRLQVVSHQLGNYLDLDPLINSDLFLFGVSISKVLSGNIDVSISRPVWKDEENKVFLSLVQ